MQQYLVFRLYGPLASWGTTAVGEERPTASMPSRSALLGLLGAALGIRRDDETALSALQSSVCFGIKQCAPGTLLRDYHTAQVPPQRSKVVHLTRQSELSDPSPETILSKRDYRCDGLWVVAVWLSQGAVYTLEQLQQALRQPVFQLYLGRKSCPPALPLAPALCSAVNLKDALNQPFAPLTRSLKEDGWWLQQDSWARYSWEGDQDRLGGDVSHAVRTTPWDEPLNRARWQFSQRVCYQLDEQEA
ncbi:type I-E CRISPR-associated protein Cas5/CasD [Alcaligenes sp. SDU_A2]|uniref:type I-E CRISPR-associated protein Cas5/CasD n=1 Tax=Alcaligenes sp. SDU_A2 TaxID=3136634 RepID=UPI00311E28F9